MLRILFLMTLMLTVFGCGSGADGPERVPVSGQVSYGGLPIEDGKIRFVPIEGTEGPATLALIEQGKYTADHNGGVPVGTHRVEVEAYRPQEGAQPVTEEMARDFADLEVGQVPQEQFLPGDYSGETSSLRLTIESGSDAMTKDFTLGEK